MIKLFENVIKSLHVSSDFQHNCYALGHSINQAPIGFVGSCSFHHLLTWKRSDQVKQAAQGL